MNKLSTEKSPYLLQHQNNPVDWYPWGEEAFQKARSEDKPVFLSIGYSTCHWCHVMERESFENKDIAELMNRHFVSIKVDREERPDIDQIYMTSVVALTGQGGWPLSVFLTPDAMPFYGGTYFPPVAKWGSPGFGDILQSVQRSWKDSREKIVQSGIKFQEMLNEHLPGAAGQSTVSNSVLETAYGYFAQNFDAVHGGFGPSPKFPSPHNLLFLLRYGNYSDNDQAIRMVSFTLEQMGKGGIFDHVGGGFHRYSTDERWHVPHFEKMLYDQAMLTDIYLEAYQATGQDQFSETALKTLNYVIRDLRDGSGGFYSAEDADSIEEGTESEKKEGAFYVWEKPEIDGLLGDNAELFSKCYDIRPDGNAGYDPHGEFTHKNILSLVMSGEECAKETGIPAEQIQEQLNAALKVLFDKRASRNRPHRDEKILTDWNGLIIAALAKGGRILKDQRFLDAAESAAGFILDNVSNDEKLLHRFCDGEAAIDGMLDDYAFMIHGLIELYISTYKCRYLTKALNLADIMIDKFRDEAKGGFFMTSKDNDQLIVRPKDLYDGAYPSGNSIAVYSLTRLYHYTFDERYREITTEYFSGFASTLESRAFAYCQSLSALLFDADGPVEIIIAGEQPQDTAPFVDALNKKYFPSSVVAVTRSEQERAELGGVMSDAINQVPVDGKVTAYVCRNKQCNLPVHDVGSMIKLISGKA